MSAIKKCTNLTGLAVARNSHRSLTVLYNKILRALENIPETSVYRQHMSKVVQERLTQVNSEPDVPTLEAKINSGQVEELILEAEKELMLARKIITWKPWEPLQTEPPANQWKWPL